MGTETLKVVQAQEPLSCFQQRLAGPNLGLTPEFLLLKKNGKHISYYIYIFYNNRVGCTWLEPRVAG